MKLDLKKSISIYSVILLASTLLLVVLASYTWQEKLVHSTKEQSSYLELLQHSTQALLESQETLLLTLGNQALTSKRTTNNPTKLVNLDLHKFDAQLEFLLFLDSKQRIKSTSSNLTEFQKATITKIKTYEDTSTLAVTQPNLAIGKTYLFEGKTIVAPIAKAIYDQNYELLGVFMATINLSSEFITNSELIKQSGASIGILRRDKHWQVKLGKDVTVDYFDRQVSDSRFSYLITPNESLNQFSLIEVVSGYVLEGTVSPSLKVIIPSVSTNSWYISEISTLVFIDDFLRSLSSLILVYVLFNIVTSWLIFLSYKNDILAQNRLIEQSMYDPLTLLPNGLYLRMTIADWMNVKNLKQDFSLLYVDIDNFKSVNVSHGQEFGDKVLKLAAERLLSLVNADSLLIRQTGNGFIYLTKSVDQFVLDNYSQDILYALSVPFKVDKNTCLLGSSIGIATYPQNGDTLNSLISAAELALREAKKTLNTALFFTDEMQESNRYKMRVEQKLRQAIKEKAPYVVYQPQLDSLGHLYGVEVLVRWTDDELGVVSPESFVAIAESSGLIVALGELVFAKAFKELEMVQKRQNRKFQISLNVSIRQFVTEGFVENLKRRIAMYNLDPAYITLEITENLFIEDLEKMKPIFRELRELAIKISLDDFGTGYSSLSMLTEVELDELKIDKNFVDNIHVDPQSLTMVKNIIAIGKNYNMSILAEGVETIDQKEVLKRCGCDAFQGYFYSKPVLFYELEEYLKSLDNTDNVVPMIK